MSTTHRTATGIAATLALATAAAPASATPWDPNSRDPSIPVRSAPEPAMIAPAPSHVRGPVVVQLTTARGFDWGDAGIGAAGATAVALLGVGATIVISERKPSPTRRSAAQPN